MILTTKELTTNTITVKANEDVTLVQTDTLADTLNVHLYENATFKSIAFADNKNTKNCDITLEFHEPGAHADLFGLAILSEGTAFSSKTEVIHHIADCTCDQVFKTILMDKAKATFNGMVTVKPKAHGTQSNQLNNNLLLSDTAHAISIPQLQIDADDVECSHGCTVGTLNEEEVFYLMSRGLNKKEAQQLLTYGFGYDIIQHIPNEDEKQRIITLFKDHLSNHES